MERIAQSVTSTLSVILFSFVLAACGGGGSSSNPEPSSSSSSSSSTSSSSSSSSGGESAKLTLTLGAPSSNPIVLPPSALAAPVQFISIVSGTFYPESLVLDEVDESGNLVNSHIAELMDEGVHGDASRGDRIYSTVLNLSSIHSAEKYYRVRADKEGEQVESGIGSFWISGCPARARPSNPEMAVFDNITQANIFADELMVTVAEGVSPSLRGINALVADVDGRVVGCIPSLRQFLVELDGNETAEGVYSAIDILEAKGEIVNASPNAQVLDLPGSEPALCDGQECQWYLDRIRAPEAWALVGGGDEQQSVAIIDFGVDCNHQELDCDGSVFNEDIIDHGTGVASLIGARSGDGTNVIGVAWNTQLHPYSFLGQGGSQYKLSELINAAISEESVKVINISASTGIDPNFQVRDAICNAIDSGRLVVAAAGNAASANNCQIDNIYPAKYNSVSECGNGADLQKGLLVVGATDINNNLAQWEGDQLCSNTLYVDIFAPGEGIYTASAFENYVEKDGTSYATPLVAGSAAVLWAANPELTVEEIHTQLVSTSVALSPSVGDARTNTSDTRVEGKPLLDLFRAVGGTDDMPTPDVVPDAVVVAPTTNAEPNALVTFEPIVVTGIDISTPIDIEGGFYSIDGGPFQSGASTVEAGQEIVVQVLSSPESEVTTTAEITLGGVTETFEVVTEPASNTPEEFEFYDVEGAELNAAVLSNIISLQGITEDTPITIIGGEYSIDGGTFTNEAGTVGANQTIQLRVTAADSPSATTTATVSIGGVSDDMRVTTEPADISPTPFSFAPNADLALLTESISNSVIIEGINTPVMVSISGGEYAIDNGEYTNDASVILPGQSLQLRQTSAWTPETSTYATVTVGDFNATYRTTTLAADVTPDSFSFTDVTEAELNSLHLSNTINVNGINTSVPIEISGPGAEYRVNDGAFTSVAGRVSSGDIVEVQMTASASTAVTLQATLVIGGVSDIFSVSTIGASLPDAFTFIDIFDAAVNTQVTSNSQTIAGLNSPASISVSGGEYAIDGGEFTDEPGTIENNQAVQLRHTTANTFSRNTNTTLSIAGISDTFSSTTLTLDSIPDAILFVDQADVGLGLPTVSNPVVLSGVNVPVSIRAAGGEYSINDGAWTTVAGMANNGDSIRVRTTSSALPASTTDVVLSLATINDTFSVTTLAADTTPDIFDLVSQSGVETRTLISSNSITVAGLNTSADIHIVGGEYSINAQAFTAVNGTVNNSDTVVVRLMSSDVVEDTVSATLTIGTRSDTFNVSTVGATLPDAFAFLDQASVALSSVITSNTQVITGLNSGTSIRISNGEYSLDGAPYTSAQGTIGNNQGVQIRVTSSATFNTAVTATIIIGGISDSFTVTTLLADTTPSAFTFVDQTDVALSSQITSAPIVVAGINTATNIGVSSDNGGEYSINGSGFTSVAGTVNSGDSVAVRLTSSASVSTSTSAELTIGDVNDTFSVITEAARLPNAFSFTDQTDVALSTQVVSNSQVITGLNSPVDIRISGGEYAIDGGSYTSADGTITNNQSVQVRLMSSASFDTTLIATLDIAGVTDDFSVKTLLADTTPDGFTFTDQTGVALSASIRSSAIIVAGINTSTPIRISNGEYRVNGGAFTAADSAINVGDSVEVQVTSSSSVSTTTSATLTIGDVSDNFSVTTLGAALPDVFTFTDQTDAALASVIVSNSETITGLNSAADIRVTGGEYSIDGAAFTAADSTITNNQNVRVRITSSASFDTQVTATLDIGGITDDFTVRTLLADTTPDAFSFTDQTNVELNTLITSTAITVEGMNTAASISITGGEYSINSASFTSAVGSINNGDTVTVRVTSSPGVATTVGTTLIIGGIDDTFSVSTEGATPPDSFAFIDQTGIARSAQIISNSQTISGLNSGVDINISGGEYSIDGAPFSGVPGTINNNQNVRVRVTSSALFNTLATATLNIAGVTDDFTVRTLLEDTSPAAFSFVDQTDMALGAHIISAPIVVAGINSSAGISISGGEYSVNSSAFTSAAGSVNNGDSIVVRVTSSASVSTATSAELTIGDVSDTFSVTTEAATAPNAFAFIDQDNLARSSAVVSNSQTITGLNSPVDIRVTNGEYSIGSGPFTAADGTITNNQNVRIRVTSSASFNTPVTATLNIAGVTDDFTARTLLEDTSPTAFSFVDQTDVALSTQITSAAIVVVGINSAANISITGGEYRINSTAFTSLAGTVNNSDTVVVRATSSSSVSTATNVELTIGDVTDTFSITTEAATAPNAFAFTDQTNLALSTLVTSNSQTITGLNSPVDIRISGGEYSIDGAPFTAADGTITNNQSVRVRTTSSASFNTLVTATLNIAGITDDFTARTLLEDTSPTAFSFVDQADVALGIQITSAPIAVAGINSAASISITGGQYRINSAAFTSALGTVNNGDSVVIRLASSASVSTTTNAELTIGDISDTFSVTTVAATPPNAFSFTAQTGVALSNVILSNTEVITGLNSPVDIRITGGEYSIAGAPFTAVDGTITNNQNVQVRVTSSASFNTPVTATLDIAGITEDFTVRTLLADTLPDAFSFTDQTNVALNTAITSGAISISGINTSTAISISGGQYRINSGAFTAAGGSINNGDTVVVRVTSANEFSTAAQAVLTVGTVADNFQVTTLAADTTPNSFTFTDQTNRALSTQVVSNSITVGGINTGAAISITGGEYRIGSGAWTSATGSVSNNNTVQVRLTSSAAPEVTSHAQLTIGGISDTFSVTTVDADTSPDSFAFIDQTNVARSTAITSASIAVSGINTGASISVTNGSYSINAAAFTSTPGTVNSGDSVRIRVTSSSAFATAVNATLNIGSASDTFSATTLAEDTNPSPFSFTDRTNIALSTQVESNAITVAGINSNASIRVSNGEYRIGTGAWRTAPSTVANGQNVQVRHTSSAIPEVTTNTTLTIGNQADTFSVTTVNADTTPNAFSFTPATNVALSTQIQSNEITVTGINAPAGISITGGVYQINGGTYTSVPGTINANDRVRVRVASSSAPETTTTATLTVGGVNASFNATTVDADTSPNAFTFTDASNIALSTLTASNSITVSGINSSAPISLSAGEYRIGSGAWTSSAGTLSNGQSVQVRITSSATPQTTVNATLNIGGRTDTFSVTTVNRDTTPNAFSFTPITNAALSTAYDSNEVTISGINTAASISVSGGLYQINGGALTSSAGTINPSDRVRVRLTSAATMETLRTATLTIGGVSRPFNVTTTGPDTTPDAFTFVDQSVLVSTWINSNEIVISGINTATSISISGGQFRINGGAYRTTSTTLSNGTRVQVRVMSASSVGTTTQANLTVGGVADTFRATTQATNTVPEWSRSLGNGISHSIGSGFENVSDVYTADLNGDGNLNPMVTDSFTSRNRWYINNGAGTPSFSSRSLPAGSEARSIFAADIEGDGDIDVVIAQDRFIRLFQNNGEAVEPTFTSHLVDEIGPYAGDVNIGDIDGDGDMDILARSAEFDKISWYENNGADVPTFTENVISLTQDYPSALRIADIDGDGDMDVLACSNRDSMFAWYENNGAANPSFVQNVISNDGSQPTDIHVADIDGDGDLDILLAAFDELIWYESNGATNPSFSANVLATGARSITSVSSGDMDGDGDIDIMRNAYNAMYWHENVTTGEPVYVERQVGSGSFSGGLAHAADLDGDGKVEIVTGKNRSASWIEPAEGSYSVAQGETLDITEDATDGDNNFLTYSIVSGPDELYFDLNQNTGEVTFANAPNTSAPEDSDLDNFYEMTLSASDGFSSITKVISVRVYAP